jgi:serine/threonine-protein kinase
MVTADSVVKIMDFGLAAVSLDSAGAVDPSNSPTLTMAATRAGVIMGTAGW